MVIENLEQRVLLTGLPVPTHLRATPDSVAGIDLSWNAIADSSTYSVSDYQVQRAPAPASSNQFKTIGDAFTDASYYDQTTTPTYTYRYRIIAFFSDGSSTQSAAINATAPLSAPLYLQATTVSTSQIDLSWNGDGAPFPIEIYRSTNDTSFKKVKTVAATATKFSDKGLLDGIDYVYRLRVVQGIKSAVSSSADAFTVPKAPINLSAKAVNTNEVDLTWKNTATYSDGVEFFRSDDGGKTFSLVGEAYNENDHGTPNTYADQSYQDEGGHTFKYYLKAEVTPPPPEGTPIGVFPDSIESSPSNTVTVTTPPQGVADLRSTAVSASEIDLSWSLAVNDATHIQVYGSKDGRTYSLLPGGLLAGNATSDKITGLNANTHYWYQVRAVRGTWTSGFTLTDDYTLVPPVSNLRGGVAGVRRIFISWKSNSGPNAVFDVQRFRLDNSGWQDLGNVKGTQIKDQFDQPGEIYQYSITALNAIGAPSQAVTVTVEQVKAFPGFADTSFGVGGVAGEFFSGHSAQAVAVQPDGKILVGGGMDGFTTENGFVLTRLNKDGSLDATFADKGRAIAGGTSMAITSIDVESDGKIIAAGTTIVGSPPVDFDGQVLVARYLPDGTPDPTFGTNGFVHFSLDRFITYNGQGDFGLVRAVVQSNGAIVLAISDFYINGDGPIDYSTILARVTSAGKLDSNFGHGGTKLTGLQASDEPLALALTADGHILVAAGSMLERFTAGGVLDSSFGVGGEAQLLIGDASSLALAPDGKIFVGSSGAVAAFNSNGSRNKSYGSNGVATVNGATILRNSDGTIVAVATQPYINYNTQISGFSISRLTAAGAVDHSFAADGVTLNSLGDAPPTCAAFAPDGSIVVAGEMKFSYETPLGFAVARYTPTGSIDRSFSYYGTEQAPDGLSGGVTGIALQKDGKIVVASDEWSPDSTVPQSAALVRYNADGSIDNTFGVDGRVFVQIGATATFVTLAIAPNGDIVTGGTGQVAGVNVFVIARFTPSGALDATFGNQGIVLANFGDPKGQTCKFIGLEPNGDIVAVGSTSTEIAVARYLPNGHADSSFGTGGSELLDPGGGTVKAAGAALDRNGRIVIATTIGSDFAAIRLSTNGSLDSSFGTNGIVTTSFGDSQSAAGALTIDNSGRIIVGGSAFDNFALVRYLPSGTLDRTFGRQGLLSVNWPYQSVIGEINGYDLRCLAVLPNGRIIAGGDGSNGGVPYGVVAMIDDQGLVPGFGASGAMEIDFGLSNTTLDAVAVDSHNNVLAGALGLFRLNA